MPVWHFRSNTRDESCCHFHRHPIPPRVACLDGSGGPSVGIPLSVHPLALQVQQAISRVVLYVSATRAQVLKTRIVCPFVLHGGHYDSTPKVGLLQPSIPLTVEAAIHFVGNCKVKHSLSNYLLESDSFATFVGGRIFALFERHLGRNNPC